MSLIDPMKIGQYYFPVNLSQFENLVGKMLTHIEALGLNQGAEKANKDLVKQSLWGWFDGVQENSLTSHKLCIGPIFDPQDGSPTYYWYTDAGKVQSPEANKLKVKLEGATPAKASDKEQLPQ